MTRARDLNDLVRTETTGVKGSADVVLVGSI